MVSIVPSIVISKVFLSYNTGHNKWKELFPRKLQFKVDKNPNWPESSMLLNALFQCKEGSAGPPLKNVMSQIK
jgi:hypothetical protein